MESSCVWSYIISLHASIQLSHMQAPVGDGMRNMTCFSLRPEDGAPELGFVIHKL